jgi:hypothetical protein
MPKGIWSYRGPEYRLVCSGPGSNLLRVIITEYLRAGRVRAIPKHPILNGADNYERRCHRWLARDLYHAIGPAGVNVAVPVVQEPGNG